MALEIFKVRPGRHYKLVKVNTGTSSAPYHLRGCHTGEFWLGLRKIHSLVAQGNSVLRFQLEDLKQGRRSIEYRLNLSGPETNYTIQVTHLSGDLPDPMSNHSGVMFSTKDWDNRGHGRSACSQGLSGAAH